MPLVTSKEMLLKAQQGGYAVGAFNAENMEMVKAIIQAAEELKAPVMIQTTPSTIKYGTLETYQAIVAAEARLFQKYHIQKRSFGAVRTTHFTLK